MAKPKTRLVSKFPEVKDSMRDAVDVALRLALNEGEGEAEKRLERIDDTRGYELPIDIGQDKDMNSGRIFYEPFYGIWFEYGTPTIPAASFMRPANRKMRKTFLATMPETFDGFVKRRARVSKR